MSLRKGLSCGAESGSRIRKPNQRGDDEEDRRIAEERYNLGSNTLLDLLVATANYTQARSNTVTSSYDFIYAKLQFRIAVGREKF